MRSNLAPNVNTTDKRQHPNDTSYHLSYRTIPWDTIQTSFVQFLTARIWSMKIRASILLPPYIPTSNLASIDDNFPIKQLNSLRLSGTAYRETDFTGVIHIGTGEKDGECLQALSIVQAAADGQWDTGKLEN
ncbi:unnamed protein product [Ambrosiozyma monospora]|uniref:Unnamed protein product n=1 Tax=Ambrosiozyma monospora TaxID=43982 RepID=A0ACB5SWU6_AMBMO|nr:unnamed protein product [Ambrosiozyma monospora]